MKPTYGRVSRYGMVAFASSLDCGGPLVRSVRDAALVLGALAGHDPRDATSVDEPVPDYVAALDGEVQGLRLGVPREFFVPGMEPGVETAVRAAVDVLAAAGADIVEVSLPSTDKGLATYYIITPAEASANLARYDGIRYGASAGVDDLLENYRLTRGAGFGPEVKRRIILGTYALSAGYYDAYYLKAQQVRTLIKAEFDEVLASVDALLAPTSPIGRLQDRRQDRGPAPHVPQRRLHPAGEHRRPAGDIGPVRAVGGAAGGLPGHRSAPSARRPSSGWPMPTSAAPASPSCDRPPPTTEGQVEARKSSTSLVKRSGCSRFSMWAAPSNTSNRAPGTVSARMRQVALV